MHRFRVFLKSHRVPVLVVTALTAFFGAEGSLWADVARHERAEAERLEQMAERLGVPAERLERREAGLLEGLRNVLSSPEEERREQGLARLEARVEEMEAAVAANPFGDRVEQVKNAYAPARAEALLRTLAEVASARGGTKSRREARALLRAIRSELDAALRFEPGEDVPGKARQRGERLQGRLNALLNQLRPILNAPHALSNEQIEQTLNRVTSAVEGEVQVHQRPPRFDEGPLPIQRIERKAPTAEADSQEVQGSTSALVAAKPPSLSPRGEGQGEGVPKATEIAPEIQALAAELETPAKIFAHVHDTVRFDPKWGAVRGPLGTLLEAEGTAWDQAWLLRDLLTAAGIDARFEWGEIEIPVKLLTNITGVSDPFRAGDLLTTGGVPTLLLVEGGRVVGAKLTHVWVKAHVDYIPNRGATVGTPDSWIRMDPSLKRTRYQDGLLVHESVAYELGSYLRSGTALSPRRAYEDALWASIRANDINCSTLEQLKDRGSVIQEGFPILPGTLRGKIVSVSGEAPDVPADFQHRVRLEARSAGGETLLSHEIPWPSAWGKRVELAYRGATAEDRATIDSYGGIFETPPYLVDLLPAVKVAGAVVAEGSPVGSAEDVQVRVTLVESSGFETVRTHQTLAGEHHALAVDFGRLPQESVDRHRESYGAAVAAGDEETARAEELHLLGAQYLHELGGDLTDLAGWKHHRLVRVGTEALVSQSGEVSTTVGGTPVSLTRAERFIDVAGTTLGLFHVDGDRSFRRQTFELLVSQGSFLEGQIFEQVLEQRGVSAVAALTESKRRGQTLTRVDAGNVSTVLDQVDLDSSVEHEVEAAVARGRIAWVAENEITVDRWTGTGYVLEDPETGAAGYLISGGLAGGSETGEPLEGLQDILGSEDWLEGSPFGALLRRLFDLLGGGGDGGDDGPSTQKSDPINLSTGNLWRTETDLTIQARGLPIVWSRTYNSRSNHDGAFGHGWTFSYGESLTERADGSVLYREADGTEHVFEPDGAGGYTAPPGKYLTLTKEADGFRMRTQEGLVSELTADGRLTALSEPNGNTVTLGYDAAGNLATVTDAAGRTVLTVTTDASGRITRIEDLAGRTVEYAYTGSDLTSVTDTVGETWTYSYDSAHNLIGRSDPLGNADTYAYDTHDRCYKHVDPTGAEETFSYASRGSRAVLTDRRGFDTYVEFDERGRATLEADPLGNAKRSTWDQDNNRLTTTDPRGGTTTRTFDDQGNVLTETDPLGNTTTYTYEPQFNQVATTTDSTGHTVTNSYDSSGNLVETSQVVGGETLTETFTYDATGLLESRTDARGQTTTFTFDPTKGSLESQTDPAGNTMAMATDALGRVTAITDPEGNAMAVTWDGQDRLVGATDPFGNETSITYDAAGRQTATTTPRGTSTTDYDAVGRPIASTDPLGNTTRTEYDAAGNAIARIDAKGNRSATTYDPIGRVAARVDPLGAVWSYGYCAEIGGGCGGGGCSGSGSGGSFCELTDPLGNTTRQELDALGRVTSVTDPEGNTSTMEYDPLGRTIAETDALARTKRMEYDDLGRLTAVVEANGARSEYSYDGTGNLTEILDAEGRTWTRTYDALGRLASEIDPLGNTTRYGYDALGNRTEKTKPDGRTITYEYDVRRRTAVVLPDGTRETFDYDALGRRTGMQNPESSLSMVYDALNRVTEVTNQTLSETISYSYDPNGNRTKMTGPMGAVTYVHDAANRLVTQTDPATGTYRLGYDAAGRRTRLEYPNGVTTEYDYDSASRLLLLLTRDPQGNTLDGYRYTVDPVGNRTSMRSLRDDVLHQYDYDRVDRLTRWQRGPDRFEAYTYDQVGNRLQLQDERGTVTSSYDQANRLLEEIRDLTDGGGTTTTYSWDPNGNLTEEAVSTGSVTTYTWDALNRLTRLDDRLDDASGIHTYGYDPNGIRVRETNDGDTTRFLHAAEDIVASYQGGTVDTYYTHGPGIDEPWAQLDPGAAPEEQLAYLHRDGLGSVTAISNPEAQLHGTTTYAAFGQVEQSTGLTSRYGYTSRELDPTGLMYYRARYYQPRLGRLISIDPYPLRAENPRAVHRYAYVENNPVNATDPLGLFRWLMVGPIIHGLIYLLDERCPQFAECLYRISAQVIPTVIGLLHVAAEKGALPWLVSWSTAQWLHDQNRCMFGKWRGQDSVLWSQSHEVCAARGASSDACCRARIQGEQGGYNECLPTTRHLARFSPFVQVMTSWPYDARVNFGAAICGCR